jgi:hypothetical protein
VRERESVIERERVIRSTKPGYTKANTEGDIGVRVRVR